MGIRQMIYHVYPWIYHVYTWWIYTGMVYPWIYHVYPLRWICVPIMWYIHGYTMYIGQNGIYMGYTFNGCIYQVYTENWGCIMALYPMHRSCTTFKFILSLLTLSGWVRKQLVLSRLKVRTGMYPGRYIPDTYYRKIMILVLPYTVLYRYVLVRSMYHFTQSCPAVQDSRC